tara:strand:- start:7120 stop:8151 length:1032 start_codon:yes stop_codon:yes gene_type:complete
MKALIVDSIGQNPKLAVREIPVPVIKPGEVLIKVMYAGLCGHDLAVMRGLIGKNTNPLLILGHEISGQIMAVGDEVSSHKIGDNVFSTLVTFCGHCEQCSSGHEYRCASRNGIGHGIPGGFAEFVSLPAESVLKIPEGIDIKYACLLSCPMGVAVRSSQSVARIKRGDSVLITGGGGGLGIHLALVANYLGARVIVSTSSPNKVAQIERLGISEVVLINNELPLSEVILAMTEDQGVSIAFDTIGAITFKEVIRSTSLNGRIILLGEIQGSPININLTEMMFREARVFGLTGASIKHIESAIGILQSQKFAPVISGVFRLEDAAEAYKLVQNKEILGRVVFAP